MKYKTVFGIDGGVSSGFGLKTPDYIEKENEIFAESDFEAMKKSIELAKKYSYNHLNNPETGYTIVKILILKDEKGRPLYQESLNKDLKINFEEACAVVRRFTL